MDLLSSLKNSDFKLYLGTFASSIAGFALLYQLSHLFLRKVLKLNLYLDLDKNQRADFVSRITSEIHSIIGFVWAYHSIYLSCDSGKSIFDDAQCFCSPSQSVVMLTFFSSGQITYDLFICLYSIKDFSPLGVQNLLHHSIGLCATLFSIFSFQYNFTVASATVFTELSTIFLNVRYVMIKSKNAEGLAFMSVMAAFSGTFFYARLWVQLKVTYGMFTIKDQCGLLDTSSSAEIFDALNKFLLVSFTILNVYWGWGIVKAVRKVLTGGLTHMKAENHASSEGEDKQTEVVKQE